MSAIASRLVENATSKSPSKNTNLALWVAQGLLALAFVGAGTGKLLGPAAIVALYDAIGLGQWFRYVTGIVELTGAGLVIIPRTRVIGAGLLASTMLGAIITHLFVLHNSPAPALVLLVVASLVLLGRRAEVASLIAKVTAILESSRPSSSVARPK